MHGPSPDKRAVKLEYQLVRCHSTYAKSLSGIRNQLRIDCPELFRSHRTSTNLEESNPHLLLPPANPHVRGHKDMRVVVSYPGFTEKIAPAIGAVAFSLFEYAFHSVAKKS